MFDSLEDARRELALWRYDYNNVRPHSSLANQTPAEARRTLEQFEGSAPDALAQTNDEDYKTQTRKLSLSMREPRGQVRTFVAQAANEFCYNHIASFLVDAKSPSASKSMVTFYFDNMVSIKNRRRVWGLLLIRKRLNFLDPKGSITLPCNCGLAG